MWKKQFGFTAVSSNHEDGLYSLEPSSSFGSSNSTLPLGCLQYDHQKGADDFSLQDSPLMDPLCYTAYSCDPLYSTFDNFVPISQGHFETRSQGGCHTMNIYDNVSETGLEYLNDYEERDRSVTEIYGENNNLEESLMKTEQKHIVTLQKDDIKIQETIFRRDDDDNEEKKQTNHYEDGGKDSSSKVVLSKEVLTKYFYMPITQAAKELNVGLTLLKRRCRELGIGRWPHRKLMSLQTLIENVQQLKNEGGEGAIRVDEVIEILKNEKRSMEEMPDIELGDMTKKLRQACFKANYKKRKTMAMMNLTPFPHHNNNDTHLSHHA